ncbi:hypothetical protein B0A48_06189 [Cryoendolithus antarcticus]|uniref:Alpha/beta hydrolase fold-3 domain-containing protein n=1 Tax=Cryoendolithus antarcticus TaxID=1507870 RepID=A0A1V8TAC8_9PEZI|nr:hypothetical protein B0A48_06189 [Cryoendolithus antarcticus]
MPPQDHALGRPSRTYRKYQIFTVVALWSLYLRLGNRHGPPFARRISAFFAKHLTPWHSMVLTMLYTYLMRNFSTIVGLEPREPLAGKYNHDYFRATWVATALDAGFWKAMWLRPKWLRDLVSMGATMYYLVCTEQADEYVRKMRSGGNVDIDHMRVSWNKGKTPYIKWMSWLVRPRYCMRRAPVRGRIERPEGSKDKEPIDFWLYYDDSPKTLKRHNKIILDIPGGGFVAMDPRCHDDKLLSWAGKSGLPVVALNYKKAPEHPFPYAVNECYEAYLQIVRTKGRCIGLSGDTMPKIVVSGDSAGGNLAAALILKILHSSPSNVYDDSHRNTRLTIPLPEALIMIYPALDMNITSFMRPEDVALMNKPEYRKENKNFIRRKSEQIRRLAPKTPHGSDDEEHSPLSHSPARSDHTVRPPMQDSDLPNGNGNVITPKTNGPKVLRTQVKMSSMITHIQDRVLPPELLRAMILLYIGPQDAPTFSTNYLLSPLLAPENLLARFPKVYMLCGESDPLVDDTVLFAGRLRQAKRQKWQHRVELGLEKDIPFDPKEVCEFYLIEGVSHGFLQFVSVYHPGWDYIDQCRRWMMDAFHAADLRDLEPLSEPPTPTPAPNGVDGEEEDYFTPHYRHHSRTPSGALNPDSLSDTDDRPLELAPLKRITGEVEAPRVSRRKKGKTAAQRARMEYWSGRRSPVATRSEMKRIASEADLMGRRMEELSKGLWGQGVGKQEEEENEEGDG